jgi:acetyl esterase
MAHHPRDRAPGHLQRHLVPATKLVPDVTTVDTTIPGPAGTELTATVYTPIGPGPFPAVVYFHGGGWVIGNRQTYDAGARALANGAQAVVISVDYRWAPENKFPAAWDDALAAYKWTTSKVGSWRGDPRRLALAGEGAGGNLAISTAIATVVAGVTRPKAVIAIYPVTQAGATTESYVDSVNAKPLNKAMIGWFFDKTVNSVADKSDPRLDIIHAKLSLLPPVTIINAQIDPLRSDGAMLEEALKQVNVKVKRKEYEGVTHDFFGAAASPAGRQEGADFRRRAAQGSIRRVVANVGARRQKRIDPASDVSAASIPSIERYRYQVRVRGTMLHLASVDAWVSARSGTPGYRAGTQKGWGRIKSGVGL